MTDEDDISALLRACREGDRSAFDRLVPLVYQELRVMARRHRRRTPAGVSLDTTSLVHEAYLKLAATRRLDAADRGHLLAISARAMRQVIVSHARRWTATKRGGGIVAAELEDQHMPVQPEAEWLLDVDRALERLQARSERLARVVECRFFAGLSETETAEALGVSLRTAQRDWLRARAWIREELEGERGR